MIERPRRAGLESVGFLGNEVPPHTEVAGFPVLARIEHVALHVKAEGIDEVVVALPLRAYDQFLRLIAGLRMVPARIRIAPLATSRPLFFAQRLANLPA
jgi:hypothetical protein